MRVVAPANAKKLGSIKAGNNATRTTCDYEEVIAEAKEKAVKMGGNLVKITELVEPTFISKCYGIRADVYAATSPVDYKVPVISSDTSLEAGADYALLYLYRLKDTLALEPSYTLHLGKDSVIGRAKSKWSTTLHVYKTGDITIWAANGHQTNLKLNIKAGNTYYIRCGLQHGEVRMEPVIELVDKTLGATEYSQLNKGKKENGLQTDEVKYLQQIH